MSAPGITISMLTAHLRRAAKPELGLKVDMAGCVIEVESNSEELIEYLKGYFEPFLAESGAAAHSLVTALEMPPPSFPYAFTVKEPDPGKTKIKEEFLDLEDGRVVRKRLTDMIFAFGGGRNLAVGPCIENPNQVVNFINNRFIQYKLEQGCLLGHAAGVVSQGRGLAMAGFSGMGKSTLALHLMGRGADFVSNDRLMITRDGNPPTMYGVAKHPRINPGTALTAPGLDGIMTDDEHARFSSLSDAELWTLEHKYDAIIEECYGPGRFHLQAPMSGLVLLNWKLDNGPLEVNVVDPNERRDLLPALMKETGLFYLSPDGQAGEPSADEYAEVLSRCTVVEMSGGVDFEAAATCCMKFFCEGRFGGRCK
jgi:HprK-related kinase B